MSNQAINTIASAMSSAISAVRNTLREQVTSLVTSCENEFGGDYMPDKIAKAISERVALDQGWQGKTSTVRKSEVRAILGAYPFLVEGIAAFEKQTGNVGWHSMVKLARQLPLHNSTKAAVLACISKSGSGNTMPADKQFGRALGMLKNITTRSAKLMAFRRDLAKLCTKHGISY